MAKESQESDKSLSFQEKLDLIDNEIHKLHMFCVKSGYSPDQIQKFTEPFNEKLKEVSRTKWKKRLLSAALFVVMSYVLFQFDPVEKFVSTVGRRAAIQILPIYDWTKFYGSNCLVSNPLHESQSELKLEDCNACESVNKIERIKDVTESKLVNKYLKQDMPIIVQDGLKQNDISKFTVDFLTKIFEDSMFEGCEFTSNVKVRGHRSFLKQVNAGEHEHYFAYWRNCFEEPAKEFRFHFKKPYFFSSVVELIDTNWVYISKNYTAKSSKPVLIEGPVIMLMQMKGSVDIVLIPDKLCSDICSEVTETLYEGEILLLTDFLWLIDYYPRGTGESIGIGVTASFD